MHYQIDQVVRILQSFSNTACIFLIKTIKFIQPYIFRLPTIRKQLKTGYSVGFTYYIVSVIYYRVLLVINLMTCVAIDDRVCLA